MYLAKTRSVYSIIRFTFDSACLSSCVLTFCLSLSLSPDQAFYCGSVENIRFFVLSELFD